jgi:hypothetical protein
MSSRGLLLSLLVAALPVSLGCQAPAPCPVPRFVPPELPAVERQLAPVDVSRVPDSPPPAPGTANTAGPYYRLTAEECRQFACASSTIANLIETAAANDNRSGCGIGTRAADQLRETVAWHLSAETRNRSAGAALDLYYRLLEAELLADVLAASQKEVDALVSAGEKMTRGGFTESAELFRLRKQQVDLQAKRTQLRSGIAKLNDELKSLTNLTAVPGPLLPTDQLQVTPEPLDPEQAVRVGLATRPDLQLLRALVNGLDHRTFQAVRQALANLVPPLGAVTAASRVLAPGLRTAFPFLNNPDDVDALRRQVGTYLADREREAVKEIRAAVNDWATELELVVIAKRRLAVETERVRELRVKRESGAAVEADYRRAKLEALQAEADLIREATKWKQADVKVRQTLGMLCGGGH